ncbi:PEPxxWA-CTERM sorting domain-containing protein [Pseudoduganella sp. CY13W]|uniref:PEPxxWA-CTERM sorting domain-containing protein n=2 Tax=Duganella qianjiadongensis TaxID=2692176 RepID=A0ABW9VQH1_9BURK|nr:PEPxxWA-CTERM sorting domain-containing protein [Duganella qianjiadongensis]
MDPTFAACAEGAVTQNDLAAFDAMGWNLNQNILNQPGYRASSADIYAMEGLAQAVPEPASYAMLLAGLGIAGGLARRRNSQQA